MTKNKYWSREIGNSGAFEDSGFYKGSDKGYEWEYLKVEKIDSTRKEYFDFAPLHFLTETSPVYSDVVFCQFSEPLEKDSIYEIKMWVLPAECIAIPSIQVYFSDTKILKADKLKNASRVDLIRPDSSMIINKLVSARKKGPDEFGTFYSNWIMQFENKWICISGTYKASGGEKFFYIGNVNTFNYVAYSSQVKKNHLVPLKSNDPHECPPTSMQFHLDDVSVRKKQ